MSDALSPGDLQDLLAHLLAGAAGGEEAHWRELVGKVEVLPVWIYPRGNWRVSPKGTRDEQATILQAVEIVRGQHPYVTERQS